MHRCKGISPARATVCLAAVAAGVMFASTVGAQHSAAASMDDAAVELVPPAVHASAPTTDSAAVAGVVRQYHVALEQGDSAAALALLTPDAVILESGGMESLAEYRAHHLPADIEFARAIRDQRGEIRVSILGNVAWAASTSTAQGTFRDRAVDSAGAELMVLVRTAEGWRIAAIHWSSRRRS